MPFVERVLTDAAYADSNVNNTVTSSSISPRRISNLQPLPSRSAAFDNSGFYFLFKPKDITKAQILKLVINPEEFIQQESSTSNVILTAGDIFSDSFGPGLISFRITGTFGHRPKKDGIQTSGHLEVLRLRDLFRRYLEEVNPVLTPDPQANSAAELRFYNPKDNEFWRIEPTGIYFTLRRSRTSPFLYRYELQFTAISAIGGPKTIFDALFFYRRVGDVLNDLSSKLDTLTLRISDIDSTIRSFSKSLNIANNVFETTVTQPLIALNTAVADFTQLKTQVINYTSDDVRNIANNCRSMLDAISDKSSTSSINYAPLFVPDPSILNVLNRTILTVDKLLLYPNLFIKVYVKSDFISQAVQFNPNNSFIDISKVKTVEYVPIKNGDSLESIAASKLGDAAQWKILAEFNILKAPYISTTSADGVLIPGDLLAIPYTDDERADNGLIFNQPGDLDKTSVLGTDLALDQYGDLRISGSGDLATVSGVYNMSQAVRLRLGIYKGELIQHTDYGVDSLLGIREVSTMSAVSKASLDSSILSDPRVSGIKTSHVTIDKDVISYQADVFIKTQSQPLPIKGKTSAL